MRPDVSCAPVPSESASAARWIRKEVMRLAGYKCGRHARPEGAHESHAVATGPNGYGRDG